MQNLRQNFRKSSVFEKPGIFFSKIEKFLWAPTTTEWIFYAEILQTFPTDKCLQKSVRDFFILLRSSVVCKNKRRPCLYTLTETRFFYIFINNSISKENKKYP